MKKILVLTSLIFTLLCPGVYAQQPVKSMDFRISVYIPPIVGVNVAADYPGAFTLAEAHKVQPETTIEHTIRDNQSITLQTTVMK